MTDSEDDVNLRTVGYYNRYASEYTHWSRSFSRFPGLDDEIRAFASLLPSSESEYILDIGCGSGRDAILMEELGFKAIAADRSHEMLRCVQESSDLSRIVQCDVLSMPFPDRLFSGVIASGILIHLPKSRCLEALLEIRRVLIPKGLAMISMKRGAGEGWRESPDMGLERWFSYFDPQEFVECCSRARLVCKEVEISHRKDWFSVSVEREVLALFLIPLQVLRSMPRSGEGLRSWNNAAQQLQEY